MVLPAYEQLFLRFMRKAWQAINRDHLQGRLRTPVFSLSAGRRRLGSWHAETRTLSLAQDLFLRHSEIEVLEVLKHEMAHQYADEVLQAGHLVEPPHGDAFRRACELLQIHHHARYHRYEEAPKVVGRIRKLLALAESSNLHESQAAMEKARELMARYEADHDVVQQDFHYQFIGQPLRRRSITAQLIASLLTRYFHVEVVWMPSQTLLNNQKVWLLEACGTKTNLDVADYVHEYLLRELETRWLAMRRRNPTLKGQAAKRDFQVGVLKGLDEKLALSETTQATVAASHELIVVRRDRLRSFFHQRHPQLRRGRKTTYRLTDSYEAGRNQGRAMNIRRGLRGQDQPEALDRGRRIGS